MMRINFSLVALLGAVTFISAAPVADPVADYLQSSQSVVYGRSDRHFYRDDKVYKLEVDLNNDGKKETLVSSSLDRDGKQGNVFYVYKQVANGFQLSGQMHLGTYIGPIDEIGSYGIVTFFPGGGGTGGFAAYVFDGNTIREIPLGSIERHAATGELNDKGLELMAKYSSSPPDAVQDPVEQFRTRHAIKAPDFSALTSQTEALGATELGQKYGINVDPKTYEQALREGPAFSTPRGFSPRSTARSTAPRPTPLPSASGYPNVGIVLTPSPTATAENSPAAKDREIPMASKTGHSSWLRIGAIGVVVLLAAAFAWNKLFR
jgi:hypothetical protein